MRVFTTQFRLLVVTLGLMMGCISNVYATTLCPSGCGTPYIRKMSEEFSQCIPHIDFGRLLECRQRSEYETIREQYYFYYAGRLSWTVRKPYDVIRCSCNRFDEHDPTNYCIYEYDQCVALFPQLSADCSTYGSYQINFYNNQAIRYQDYIDRGIKLGFLSDHQMDLSKAQDSATLSSSRMTKDLALIADTFNTISQLHRDMQSNCIASHNWKWAYYNRGKIHFNEGLHENAMADARAFLAQGSLDEKEYAEVLLQKGSLANELGKYSEAIITLK